MKYIKHSIFLFFLVFILMACEDVAKSVTIQFDTQGGNIINDVTLEVGQAYEFPIPVREGYTFTGWYFSPTDTTPYVYDPLTFSLQTLKVYAKWNVITYNISYILDGGVNGSNPLTYDIEDGDITLLAATKEGYAFNGWYLDASYQTLVTKVISIELKDLTLYARFTINTYTITFNSDGGSLVSPITQNFNTAIIAPSSPTRVGYTFTGWDKTIPTVMPASNLTIKALWDVITYTVSYNLDNGISFNNPLTYTIEDSVISLLPASKVGYTFNGWYLDNTYTTVVTQILPTDIKNISLYARFTINTYTITFDTDGGSLVLPINQDYNTAITAPSNPTRNGYTFTGWDVAIPTLMPASNTTIKALWDVITYTVSYNLDNGINGNNPVSYTIEDSVITLLPASKVGYTFNGWYLENTYTTEVTQIVTTDIKDITLYGRFTINTYTISFNSDGGSIVSSIIQDYNTTITNPVNPTKEGHTFTGWDITIPTVMPASNTTIKALWEVITYTVSYNLDNGVNGNNPLTYTIEDSVITLLPASKVGYTFNGWYLDNTYTTVVTQILPTDIKNISLYARFTINTYTITFNSDGGSVVSSITQDYNTAITAPSNPTRNGYTFIGWDLVIPTVMPASNLTIKALWEVITYTVSYNLDNGINGNNPVSYTIEDNIISLLPASKVGYTFNGWYVENTYTTVVTQILPTDIKDMTLYARFTINTYTITFNSDGGSIVSSITQDYNTAITNPSNPTKEGHTFTGWDITIPTVMPASNTTIKAIWSVNSYTITFNTEGGTLVSSITQNYNTSITTPSNPTRVGYTFAGWDQVIPTKMPASNLVIKALWIIDTYAITYNLDGGLLNNPVNEYTIETDTIILEKPTKEGFAFMGYFDNALFTGNIITEITLGSISNKTLFAKFERINTWFIDIDEQTSETIIISIYVQGYVDFAGFDFVLTYNSNAITYENSTNPLGAIINTQNSGSITMVFVDALNTKTDETLISKITFNTTSTQSYDIELSIKDMITITKDFDIINVSYHVIPFVVEVVLPKVTLTFTDVEGISLTSYTLDANETITNINYPEAPVIAGYRFTGWSQQIPTQMGVTHITIQAIYEQIQMTLSELSAFDGRNGNKAYIAVSGKIYDVTGNPFWSNGNHNGYQAGQDLTVQLSSSPHGIANVLRQPLVGFLKP